MLLICAGLQNSFVNVTGKCFAPRIEDWVAIHRDHLTRTTADVTSDKGQLVTLPAYEYKYNGKNKTHQGGMKDRNVINQGKLIISQPELGQDDPVYIIDQYMSRLPAITKDTDTTRLLLKPKDPSQVSFQLAVPV